MLVPSALLVLQHYCQKRCKPHHDPPGWCSGACRMRSHSRRSLVPRCATWHRVLRAMSCTLPSTGCRCARETLHRNTCATTRVDLRTGDPLALSTGLRARPVEGNEHGRVVPRASPELDLHHPALVLIRPFPPSPMLSLLLRRLMTFMHSSILGIATTMIAASGFPVQIEDNIESRGLLPGASSWLYQIAKQVVWILGDDRIARGRGPLDVTDLGAAK